MNACSWIHDVVTLADGRKIASNSEEWRAECEARHVLRMNHTARTEFMTFIEQRRGAAAAESLRACIEATEPAYVLELPNKAQRNAYLRTVELNQGENASEHLRNRCMDLHGKREAACAVSAA
jgi:hypothetical protein